MPVPALIEVTNRDFQCVARSKARSRKHLFFPNEESRPSKASTCSEIVFDLDGMPQVAEFRELETLISGQLMLTDAGAHHLATLLRLKGCDSKLPTLLIASEVSIVCSDHSNL